MAFYAEREGLNSLQKQESVERRQRGTSVSLTDRSASRDKCSIPEMVDINDTVIRDFRPIEHVKLFRILAPGKFTAVHNHPADARATPANELRHRMHDDIGAVLDGPQQN